MLGAGVFSGCCSHPGVFSRLEQSLTTVQKYYEPLVKELGETPVKDKVEQAVVAADTTLLLIGELQRQWCPPIQAVEQVVLAAAEAERLAQEAGMQGNGAGLGR